MHLYYGEDLPVRYLYTFGSPRVGNDEFTDFFNNGTFFNPTPVNTTVFRVTHWMDPVPHLPPKGFLGYEHTASEVFYTANGTEWKECDHSGEDKTCANQHELVQCLPHYMDHSMYLGRPVGGASC